MIPPAFNPETTGSRHLTINLDLKAKAVENAKEGCKLWGTLALLRAGIVNEADLDRLVQGFNATSVLGKKGVIAYVIL